MIMLLLLMMMMCAEHCTNPPDQIQDLSIPEVPKGLPPSPLLPHILHPRNLMNISDLDNKSYL